VKTVLSRTKRARHAIEYAGVRLALALAARLPLGLARGIGVALGGIAFDVVRVRRAVVIDNIERSLGVGRRTAGRIGRRSYANLGRSLMEFSAQRHLDHERVRALVRLDGSEHLDAALAAGRGAVIFGGHYGNWELLGAALAAHGYPIHFLVGEQTNRRVDDAMNDLRRRQGIGIITRDVALRKVLRTLRENQIVALLGDQDAREAGVFVDFLGRSASTVRGPAMFAARQRCPIVASFIRREGHGCHAAVLEAPLYADPSLEGEAAVADLTQRATHCLATHIRRHPEEYFWAHRRWKTAPLS
jgi:KDO2-lipid IV(A) lauroyltransferase